MSVVSTPLGRVAGVDRGGSVSFLGLPFAQAPVGERRWRVPEAALPWQGVFAATENPKRSFQLPFPSTLGAREIPGAMSEDMLYLNVHTPCADGKRRPVLVYIHGGGYTVGSANDFDPTPFTRRHDVVTVAMNYRLGIFGFFDLSRFGDDYAGSVSLGFQDQIAALRWIRENIAAFGGDPGNITISGVSAGAGSVLALCAAPTAKGLFQKAIAFSPGEIARAPADMVSAIAQHLGMAEADLLAHLRTLSAQELFNLQVACSWAGGAAVDGKVITLPAEAAVRARVNSVPLIIGTCINEGTMLTPSIEEHPLADLEGVLAGLAVTIGAGDGERYFRFLDTHLPDATAKERMTRLWYDYFRAPTLRVAEAADEAGQQAWVYSFEAPTDHPFGPTHASDMAFSYNLFDGDVAGEGEYLGFHRNTAENRALAHLWSGAMAQFMRTGNPNGAGVENWLPYDRTARTSLVLRERPVIVADLDGRGARLAYGLPA